MSKFVKKNKYLTMIQEELRKSVRKILQDKGLTQAELAAIIESDSAQVSRILCAKGNFTLAHIENLATYLACRPIDIFTYPDIYVKAGEKETGPADVLLQLRLSKEKKDQVLKLVFGENNIEILNK